MNSSAFKEHRKHYHRFSRSNYHQYVENAAERNYPYVMIFCSLSAVFRIVFLVADYIAQEEKYEVVQNVYYILNSTMFFLDLLAIFTAMMFKQKRVGRIFFFYAITVYSMLTLTWALFDIHFEAISVGRLDPTLLFLTSLMGTGVFFTGLFIFDFYLVLCYSIILHWNHFLPNRDLTLYVPFIIYFLLTAITISVFKAWILQITISNTNEIRHLQQVAEEENKNKSKFLANTSHELRTPMNAIIGLSEIALSNELPPKIESYLNQIQLSGKSLLKIINNVLDFSKIESGKMEIVNAEYKLFPMLYDICYLANVRIENKPILIFLQIEKDLPNCYFGDDVKIKQVILNIVGNATKFTDKGHIIIRAQKLNNTEGVKISIIDSGSGIKKQDMDTLFDAFKQVDMEVTRKKEGTGLGLSITKSLLSLMGGNIYVDSEWKVGTKFTLEIPQKVMNSELIAAKYENFLETAVDYVNIDKLERLTEEDGNVQLVTLNVAEFLNNEKYSNIFEKETSNLNFKAENANILIVDDNGVNLTVAKGLLEKFKVKIDTASSGYECIKKINENDKLYDIIFLDHMMPGIDGIETLSIIRNAETDFRHTVIALSANAVNDAKAMFIKAGFDDFLPKPVQGEDFARCLRTWLKKELIQELTQEEVDSINKNSSIPDDFPVEELNDQNINYKKALDNAGGFENWHNSLKMYCKVIEKNTAAIRNYLEEKDIKNYTTMVHALKSSSRIVGLEELGNQAEELEKIGRELIADNCTEISADLKEKTEKLLALYEPLSEQLKNSSSYGQIKIADASQLNPEELEKNKKEADSIFEELKKASEIQEIGQIDNCIDKLKKLQLDSEYIEKINKVIDLVENFDFEELAGVL